MTQEIREDGTIIQSTGDDGPSQSVGEDGDIDQETGDDGPCQTIGENGGIHQDTDGDCGMPMEMPAKDHHVEATVVVEALPSTGQGVGSQDAGSVVILLGGASVLLMLAAGVAWMLQRWTA